MTLQIINCEQGEPDWFAARLGIPTASMFKTVMAKGKGGGASETRKLYMQKLAGEVITGEPMDNYTNDHMARGHSWEAEARNLYAMMADVEPIRVGFIRNGNKGSSPDSLIGDRGGLEIKTALAHIQIERLLENRLPPEHKAQVQGNIWVSERDWWDFVSYGGEKLPALIVRVNRDNEYIKTIEDEVERFNDELADMVARIRRFGIQEAA